MTDQPQLHDLTKFLIDRVKTYPEEFSIRYGHEFSSTRWLVAIHAVFTSGTPEDVAALRKAVMDYALQDTLKTLLVPKEEESKTVGQGQGPVRVPTTGNVSVVAPNHYGGFGVNGGPSLTQQQAQAAMAQQQAMYQQAQQQLLSGNPMPPLGTPTTVLGTTYERIKKGLGL